LNAVEIEEAISALAEQHFDAQEFPFAFLQAFGNKETTIKRLRPGASNKSDLGGVLQTNNIHIAVSAPGGVTKTLAALKASPVTTKAKAKFILATDGTDFEAEDVETGEPVACAYRDFPDHFGFFLPLAGIRFSQRCSDRDKRLATSSISDSGSSATLANRDKPPVSLLTIRWLMKRLFQLVPRIFRDNILVAQIDDGGREKARRLASYGIPIVIGSMICTLVPRLG
jgi:hypothetical protein